jgi:hypothetical protein
MKDTVPPILYLGNRWRGVVSFRPRLHYAQHPLIMVESVDWIELARDRPSDGLRNSALKFRYP